MSTLNKRKRTFSLTFDNNEDSAVDTGDEEHEEKDASTRFLSNQKNKLFEVQEHFERFVNTFRVFGLNSAKNDLNLIKFYLFFLFLNEKKSNQLSSK